MHETYSTKSWVSMVVQWVLRFPPATVSKLKTMVQRSSYHGPVLSVGLDKWNLIFVLLFWFFGMVFSMHLWFVCLNSLAGLPICGLPAVMHKPMPYIQDNPFSVMLDFTSLSPVTTHLLVKVQKIHFFTRKKANSSVVSFKFQWLVPKFSSDFLMSYFCWPPNHGGIMWAGILYKILVTDNTPYTIFCIMLQ